MQTATAVRSDGDVSGGGRQAWTRVLGRLRGEFGEGVYRSWFQRSEFEEQPGGAVILLPTRFMCDRIEKQYGARIQVLLEEEDPSVGRVLFQVRSGFSTERAAPPPVSPGRPVAAVEGIPDQPQMNFETFVEAPSNALALAACRRAAEAGGAVDGANPIYLCARQGLGKTHLMHATAGLTRALRPEARILFLDMDCFMGPFVAAIKAKSTDAFKARLRAVDLLLFDDLQFLAKRGESTREEFLSMLNALVGQGCQVIVAADTAPTGLNGVEARLKARLGAGLVVNIDPPEEAMRLEVLRRRSAGVVPDHVLRWVASRVTRSIRELTGALNRLEQHVVLLRREVDVDRAKEILADLLYESESPIDVPMIRELACEHYSVSLQELDSKRRMRRVARPRQVAMFLAKRWTSLSLPEIGRWFDRDHTTVLYGCRQIEKLVEQDPELAGDLEAIESRLRRWQE